MECAQKNSKPNTTDELMLTGVSMTGCVEKLQATRQVDGCGVTDEPMNNDSYYHVSVYT